MIKHELEIVVKDEKLKPIKWTVNATCMDLFSAEDITIEPGEIKLVWLWVKTNFANKIYPRSSLPLKKWLILANSVWIIDSDYRGELKGQLLNITKEPVKISKYEKLLQLEIDCEYKIDWYSLNINVNKDRYDNWESIDKTDRGEWWFWSTAWYN